VAEGKGRVEAINRKEAAIRAAFARVCGEDTAMLETSPCLDADAVFSRLAWLAYLSRHDAKAYGKAFLREWLMAGRYADYCGRTKEYLVSQQRLEGARAAAVRRQWTHLSERFGGLQELTRPDAEALLATAPAQAGAALAGARLRMERQVVINLLGDRERRASVEMLEALSRADHPDLAAFAKARRDEP
jgi:hypothetical protein